MSVETKQGKKSAKAHFEALIQRAQEEATPREAYLAIQARLDELETKVPESDFDRGYAEQFKLSFKNWLRRGSNKFDFDSWTDRKMTFNEEMGAPSINDLFNRAFGQMSREEILAEVNKIKVGDVITIEIKKDADPAIFHYLRGMLHSDVIQLTDIEQLRLAELMADVRPEREQTMVAGPAWDPNWFGQRVYRDIERIDVSQPVQQA